MVQDSMTFILLKTDNTGSISWTKTFGNEVTNDFNNIQNSSGNTDSATSDLGYIFVSRTSSGSFTTGGVYLNKADVNGNILWSKTYWDGLSEVLL